MDISVTPAFASDTKYFLPESKTNEQRFQNVQLRTYRFLDVQAHLLGEISHELVVVQPIQLNVEQDEDMSYVVSDDIFLIYGSGKTRLDAMREYVKSLIEFYDILKDAKTNPFDIKQFVYLQTYIQSKLSRGNYAVQADRS